MIFHIAALTVWIRRRMWRIEEFRHGRLLIRRPRENVAKPAAGGETLRRGFFIHAC